MNSRADGNFRTPLLLFTLVQTFCRCDYLHKLSYQHSVFSNKILSDVRRENLFFFQLQKLPHWLFTDGGFAANHTLNFDDYIMFSQLRSNPTKIIQSWKYSLKIKTFLFLLINNVHFMCTIDFCFLPYLADPQGQIDNWRHKHQLCVLQAFRVVWTHSHSFLSVVKLESQMISCNNEKFEQLYYSVLSPVPYTLLATIKWVFLSKAISHLCC